MKNKENIENEEKGEKSKNTRKVVKKRTKGKYGKKGKKGNKDYWAKKRSQINPGANTNGLIVGVSYYNVSPTTEIVDCLDQYREGQSDSSMEYHEDNAKSDAIFQEKDMLTKSPCDSDIVFNKNDEEYDDNYFQCQSDSSSEFTPTSSKGLKRKRIGKGKGKGQGKGKKSKPVDDFDSEYEDNDSEEFTRVRRDNKNTRYELRVELKNEVCPSTHDGNKEIIEKFEEFLRARYNLTGWQRKTSTYQLSLGWLFKYEDSLLMFETRRDPTFKLEQQVVFDHPQFRELTDPKEWFLSTAGESGNDRPNDRVEMIKVWKRYHTFVREELNNTRPQNGSMDELVRYQMLINTLDSLDRMVNNNNLMKNAKIASNLERRARENAQEYLSPNRRLAEKDSVKNWFKSDDYKQLREEMLQLWTTSVDTGKIGKKQFNRFAQFVKFQLCLTSKNRNAVYHFTNYEYSIKTDLFINQASKCNSENSSTNYITEKPAPDVEPDCWIIKLSGKGAGIKSREAQTVFISQASEELLEMYKDLKSLFLPDVPPDAPFFVNMDSKPLPEIPNTKGSLWAKFSQVNNLDKASVNTIRRGLEHEVQSSPAALANIKDIQSHSQETGAGAYYKTAPLVRATFMNEIAIKEGGSNLVEDINIPDNIVELRRKRSENEKLKIHASAIKAGYVNRKRFSKTTSVLPKDRDFLVQIFLDEKNQEIFNQLKEKFPPLKVFKKLFYRFLDGYCHSMDNEVWHELKKIEERLFLSIKDNIEKESDQHWGKDSRQINHLADMKICGIIRNCLYCHDKNKPNPDDRIFNFQK